jgi:hypothetical protein
MTPQILEERLIGFAVTIVGVVEALPRSKAGNHIANQLNPSPSSGKCGGYGGKTFDLPVMSGSFHS